MAPDVPEPGGYSDDVPDVELELEQGTAKFAEWLRAARIKAGWTKGDAIRAVVAAGVAERTYNHYEAGTVAKPDPVVVRRICKALGLNVREAAVALGILTADELELPPATPAPPTPIQNALMILHMQDVSEEDKVLLLQHFEAGLELWSRATGVKPPLRSNTKGAKKKPAMRKR